MDVSPNALRRETMETLTEVNKIIAHIRASSSTPHLVTNPDGSYLMPQLLATKVMCLNTLTLLRGQR